MKDSPPPGRKADGSASLDFDLDDWLLNLVMLNHPEWQRADGSCPECQAEIKRMQARADRVNVLGLEEDQSETGATTATADVLDGRELPGEVAAGFQNAPLRD